MPAVYTTGGAQVTSTKQAQTMTAKQAAADAKKRNESAESLGITTRYEVREN